MAQRKKGRQGTLAENIARELRNAGKAGKLPPDSTVSVNGVVVGRGPSSKNGHRPEDGYAPDAPEIADRLDGVRPGPGAAADWDEVEGGPAPTASAGSEPSESIIPQKPQKGADAEERAEPATPQRPAVLDGLRGPLKRKRTALLEALGQPLIGVWPKEASFVDAEDVAAVAGVLIPLLHEHLEGAQIAYLFRDAMSRNGKTTLGKMGKAGARVTYLAGFDFVLEVNWEAWKTLSGTQRVALVDHELSHAGHEVTKSGEDKWVLVPHDLEEFESIVTRWGFWLPDVKAFAKVCAAQTDLFEAAP